ncbi:MAG: winged helix-turn-helix domain-containing protein [Candidatus Bathyarchaeia archaeon]
MRRNELDIVADILNVAKSGLRKTRIVYSANLNFKQANRYISMLRENGLLRIKGYNYITTNKGMEFLENYNKVRSGVFTRKYF